MVSLETSNDISSVLTQGAWPRWDALDNLCALSANMQGAMLRSTSLAGQKVQIRAAVSSVKASRRMQVVRAAAADAYAASTLDPVER